MESVAEQVKLQQKTRPAEAVHVESNRFGTFDVPSERILTFPQGLVGFPASTRFVIIEHRPGSPFKWLLSLDDPELGFAVVDPSDLVAGYRPPIPFAAKLLGVDPSQVGLFAIVTIPSDPTAMTVNLLAPIAVNLRTHQARQIVLEGAQHDPAHRVLPPARAEAAPER